MTTPKAKFAGHALIAALCAGFTLGLTACTVGLENDSLVAWQVVSQGWWKIGEPA